MLIKRFNTYFNIRVQFRVGAIPRLPFRDLLEIVFQEKIYFSLGADFFEKTLSVPLSPIFFPKGRTDKDRADKFMISNLCSVGAFFIRGRNILIKISSGAYCLCFFTTSEAYAP